MSTKGDILGALRRGPMSVSDVHGALTEMDKSTIRKALNELEADGAVSCSAQSGTRMFKLAGIEVERTGTNPFEWRTYRHWSPS